MADQLILPRHDHGSDFGAKRRVLVKAEASGYMLFIVGGHYAAVGVRGFGRQYHPAYLVLRGKSPFPADTYYCFFLAEGRISKAVIMANENAIDACFGDGTAAQIVTTETLYLP